MGQSTHADVAELADALDSGSSARKGVEVQVLSSALVIFGVFRNRGQPRFSWGPLCTLSSTHERYQSLV